MQPSIRSLLAQNGGKLRLLEAHDLKSLQTIRNSDGDGNGNGSEGFQGVWISGLTQTTYLGIPDNELITPLERASLLSWLHMDPQHKDYRPLCVAFDADSGGSIADAPKLVALLASAGVSMIVVEDKSVSRPGAKVNSLHRASASQSQANAHEFARIIQAFVAASSDKDMMITARIESLTVRIPEEDPNEEKLSVQACIQDSLVRAEVYRKAGAHALMIHSKSTLPDEALSFLTQYRSRDPITPLVVVPTTYSQTTENALYSSGANIVIYGNHLMRAKIHAIGRFSNVFLADRPGLLSQDIEFSACLKVRNFGCLLRRMLATKNLSEEAIQYLIGAETCAVENMTAAIKCLVIGKKSSAADAHLIPIKDLLEINDHQVSIVGDLILGQ